LHHLCTYLSAALIFLFPSLFGVSDMMIIKAAVCAALLFAALEAVNFALSEDGPKNCYEIVQVLIRRIEVLRREGKFAAMAQQWQMFFSACRKSSLAVLSRMGEGVMDFLRQVESIKIAVVTKAAELIV
jgi:hypothetical protein